jgi:hypothetical protein
VFTTFYQGVCNTLYQGVFNTLYQGVFNTTPPATTMLVAMNGCTQGGGIGRVRHRAPPPILTSAPARSSTAPLTRPGGCGVGV